jgi:hypothetical protein
MLPTQSLNCAALMAAFFFFSPTLAPATAFQLGLGWSGLDGDDNAAVLVAEVTSRPLLIVDRFELGTGLATSLDADGDAWAGAGPILRFAFARHWRLEGSLMPGLYERGSGADLGGSIQFRSKIAVSRWVADGYHVGVALTHLSNAGLQSRNPGEDAAFLFITKAF